MHCYYLLSRFGEQIQSPTLADIVARFRELNIEASSELMIEVSLEDAEGLGCSLAISSNRTIFIDDSEYGKLGGVRISSDDHLAKIVDQFLREGRDFLLRIPANPTLSRI